MTTEFKMHMRSPVTKEYFVKYAQLSAYVSSTDLLVIFVTLHYCPPFSRVPSDFLCASYIGMLNSTGLFTTTTGI